METRSFQFGEEIFSEGRKGDEAFILKRGKVKLTIVVKDDTPRTIVTVGPGNIIGEMALIDDAPRAASAVALEDGEAMVLTKEEFQKRLDNSDPVIALLVKTYADRLRQQARQTAQRLA